jgi:cytochrome c
VASVLLARVHPFGDPHLYAAKTAQARTVQLSAIPPGPRAILAAKCADCHSMQTRAPFYGRLAPASWLMESDIVKARKAMNLDMWDGYSPDQQQTFQAKMLERIRANDMPPPQYRFIHWNARVTDADKQVLMQWARTTPALGGNTTVSVEGGDPARGKEVFEKRCTGCHAMEQNREGPKLRGVVGRTSGEVADFVYSAELKKAQIRWSARTLDQWLADPDALVPGNNMEFHVSSAQERRDLIRFLEQSAAP